MYLSVVDYRNRDASLRTDRSLGTWRGAEEKRVPPDLINSIIAQVSESPHTAVLLYGGERHRVKVREDDKTPQLLGAGEDSLTPTTGRSSFDGSSRAVSTYVLTSSTHTSLSDVPQPTT